LHSYADKSSIMSMYMKRCILLLISFTLILAGLSAGDTWKDDAVRGDAYYQAGDYDAAWLFYQRSLSKGCDDGLAVFQAAESFRLQELPDNPRTDNPDFESSLYAVAYYFLEGQYPDSSALMKSREFFEDDIVVNRRFLRQTYTVVGGKAPKRVSGGRHLVSSGMGSVSGFFISRVETLGEFIFILGSGDFHEVSIWVKGNIWSLLLAVIILNSLTGIILPVVMALTVAREGRKSYVTAYAFLLHWGFLGIHRFYMGRYISGIVWLLSGGLFGIGIFFDIFLTGAYIRFWNEDHRDERPVNQPRYTGKIKQTKVKKTRTARVSSFSKQPKPAKKPKEPKKNTKDQVEIDKSEEFSFGEEFETPSFAAAGSALGSDDAIIPEEDFSIPEPAVGNNKEEDNDFGELPDLSFDDEDTGELGEELSDEDFDLKSFE